MPGFNVAAEPERGPLEEVYEISLKIYELLVSTSVDVREFANWKSGGDFSEQTKLLMAQFYFESGQFICPVCEDIVIINDSGERLPPGHFDHWSGRSDHTPWNCWMTCRACNLRLRKKQFRDEQQDIFRYIQRRFWEWMGRRGPEGVGQILFDRLPHANDNTEKRKRRRAG